jgi:hypothetical protein
MLFFFCNFTSILNKKLTLYHAYFWSTRCNFVNWVLIEPAMFITFAMVQELFINQSMVHIIGAFFVIECCCVNHASSCLRNSFWVFFNLTISINTDTVWNYSSNLTISTFHCELCRHFPIKHLSLRALDWRVTHVGKSHIVHCWDGVWNSRSLFVSLNNWKHHKTKNRENKSKS